MSTRDVVDPTVPAAADGATKPPHPFATIERLSENGVLQKIVSTHVGETIRLPRLDPSSAAPPPQFVNLREKQARIAVDLRSQLSFDVMPVFIPASKKFFVIAHDAVMRKGLSATVLPDVVDAVAQRVTDDFFDAVSSSQ
jgi:hypothetical protein